MQSHSYYVAELELEFMTLTPGILLCSQNPYFPPSAPAGILLLLVQVVLTRAWVSAVDIAGKSGGFFSPFFLKV